MKRGSRPTDSNSASTRSASALPLAVPCSRKGLADDAAGRHARVQAVLRVLEDHLQAPAQPAQRLAPSSAVMSSPPNSIRPAVAGWRRRMTRPGGGLAAAALADEAEGLALQDLEIEAVHRLHRADLAAEHALHDREVPGQVLDPEERSGSGVHGGATVSMSNQQATSCPSATGRSGGFSRRQRSATCGAARGRTGRRRAPG